MKERSLASLIAGLGISSALYTAVPAFAATIPVAPVATPTASGQIRAPLPSLAASTPLGVIGLLERDRKTPPSKLDEYLRATDPAIAARAAIAIGRLRNPAGTPALEAVLSNPSQPEQVRAAAAFALGAIGSADALGALERALRATPSIAGAAADSIGRIGGDRAAYDLIPVLSDRNAFVRGKAAIGLGEAGFPTKSPMRIAYRLAAARELGASLFADRDPEVRWRIAWAIGRTYYPQSQDTLRRMLVDPQELVRVMAVKGINKLRDPSLVVSVRLLAKDPSWRVRVEVRNTLIALKDTSTIVDVRPPAIPDSDQATPKPLSSSVPYGDHPQVAFVTNRGTFVVEMFPDEAPYTVDSFLHLTDAGVYNNTAFFRVIWDFVVQGGGFKNDPNAEAPYSVPAEANVVEQLTGMLAFGLDYDDKTNTPKLDSAGTQFYVTESPLLHLDEAFTTMGRVVRGMAVVNAIIEHSQNDKVGTADVAQRVYRCASVSLQSPEAELHLRAGEVDYQAP